MDSKKILLIEDEDSVRENISILLQEEGYSVQAVDNGEAGIAAANLDRPDLIICDIMMKGIDGYEVLKSLSKEKVTGAIPFIFLTAKVERQDIRLGMELGADDYLFKPYKAAELLKAIESRLNRLKILKEDSDSGKQTGKNYSYDDKMFLHMNGKPFIMNVSQILFIEAENQYTSVKLVNGKSFLLRKSIAKWEEELPAKHFIRIHRAHIINMEFIVKMEKWNSSSMLVFLQNVEKPFVISKKYSAKFRKGER